MTGTLSSLAKARCYLFVLSHFYHLPFGLETENLGVPLAEMGELWLAAATEWSLFSGTRIAALVECSAELDAVPARRLTGAGRRLSIIIQKGVQDD